MEADRWLIAAGLTALIFFSMVLIGVADPSPLQQSMEASDPNETLFQGFVTAIITGVTLVVTLNQLVLSQELGPVGDQRNRMEEAMQFREDVGDIIENNVSPQEPSKFLKTLIDEIKNRAEKLQGLEDPPEELENYVSGLTENAEKVSQRLEDAQFGTFGLLSAVLNFNYSWKISEARRIRKQYGEQLENSEEKLEDLEEALKLFGPAREHFKTLYFQWELVNLSRAMLYTAVPALIVSSSMIIYHDASAVKGVTLGISNDILITGLAMGISLLPFTIFLSYILRIATVAKRTLSIGPFVLREEERNR